MHFILKLGQTLLYHTFKINLEPELYTESDFCLSCPSLHPQRGENACRIVRPQYIFANGVN